MTTLEYVNSCVRDLVKDRRVRINDDFADFDSLRSGFVSTGQFFRVLYKLLGKPLNKECEDILINAYQVNNNSREEMNWHKFISDIEGNFDNHNFSTDPECKILNTIQSFPGPKDISLEEMTALTQRYGSNKHKGYVDYLELEKDLRNIAAMEKFDKEGNQSDMSAPASFEIREQARFQPSLSMIKDRIKFATHREGIRVRDFFTDYDKLRHQNVTERQFISALELAVGSRAPVSRSDIQMLANYYRNKMDPRMVDYNELCQELDSPFITLNLERDPLKKAVVLEQDALSRGMPILSDDEERRVDEILFRFRDKVKRHRLLTMPYFQDYDLSSGNSGVVSHEQFGRVLSFLGLDVSPEDQHRLSRKFTDPRTGEFNYVYFCRQIDDWLMPATQSNNQDRKTEQNQQHGAYPNGNPTIAGTLPKDKTDKSQSITADPQGQPITIEQSQGQPEIGQSSVGQPVRRRDWLSTCIPAISSVGDDWPVETLMDRIRHLVLVNRIRLQPWFQDHDPLRSGSMARSRFESCLTAAGINRLDSHDITPKQMDLLCSVYTDDPSLPDRINWRRFVQDVNSVFTISNLERHPCWRVLPSEKFVMPRPGSCDWDKASDDVKLVYEKAMALLRRKVSERRMLLLPDFKAFDKLNRGVVSCTNFRQLVTMFNFHLDALAIDVLAARFATDDGFDYRAFLAELDPPKEPPHVEYKYVQRLTDLQQANLARQSKVAMEPVMRDAEGVLQQVKAEVFRRRIRLSDVFRDHDKLNHSSIDRATFRRAIGTLPLPLNETGLSLLEDRFKGKRSGTVDWRAFCAEIESIFQTANLEKDPLMACGYYAPDNPVAQNYLTSELEATSRAAIDRMASKVRQRRLQLVPMFADFDETHRLTVSQAQFRRVLTSLDLADLVSEKEWTALYCKYRHPLGVVDNINYQAFIEDVYRAAGMDPFVP